MQQKNVAFFRARFVETRGVAALRAQEIPKAPGREEDGGCSLAWSLFFQIYTLPKTNIAPENRPPQKETTTPTIHFQVLC